MKIDNNTLTFIKRIVSSTSLIGIEGVIIETDKVRAMHEDRSCMLFQTEMPKLPFNSLTLNRLSIFSSRLSIAEGCNNLTVDATDKEGMVVALLMKGTNVKIDYRCANPAVLAKVPKAIPEMENIRYQFTINDVAVETLIKGQTAMQAEDVIIIGNESGVSFELIDTNNDVFSYHFTDTITDLVGDGINSFVHKYPLAVLLPILKSSIRKDTPTLNLQISQKGLLKHTIDNLHTLVFPRV